MLFKDLGGVVCPFALAYGGESGPLGSEIQTADAAEQAQMCVHVPISLRIRRAFLRGLNVLRARLVVSLM